MLKELGLGDGNAKSVSTEEVDQTMAAFGVPHLGTYMFGANSRSRADRAAKRLGYAPSAPSLWEALEQELYVASQLKSMSFQGQTF